MLVDESENLVPQVIVTAKIVWLQSVHVVYHQGRHLSNVHVVVVDPLPDLDPDPDHAHHRKIDHVQAVSRQDDHVQSQAQDQNRLRDRDLFRVLVHHLLHRHLQKPSLQRDLPHAALQARNRNKTKNLFFFILCICMYVHHQY